MNLNKFSLQKKKNLNNFLLNTLSHVYDVNNLTKWFLNQKAGIM